MDIPNKCIARSTDVVVVCQEKGRTFRFNNVHKREVQKIKVDGCVVTDDSPRCDFLIEVLTRSAEEKNQAFYVELKGCDINHAIEQLQSTLQRFERRHKNFGRHCFIVSSRVPKTGTNILNTKKKFMQQWRSSFIIKNAVIDYGA